MTTAAATKANKSSARRMKLTPAAEILGISKVQLTTMIQRGVFTCQQDVPEGDRYVLTDELEFWIEAQGTPEEREERLRDFRIRKRRVKAAK